MQKDKQIGQKRQVLFEKFLHACYLITNYKLCKIAQQTSKFSLISWAAFNFFSSAVKKN